LLDTVTVSKVSLTTAATSGARATLMPLPVLPLMVVDVIEAETPFGAVVPPLRSTPIPSPPLAVI